MAVSALKAKNILDHEKNANLVSYHRSRPAKDGSEEFIALEFDLGEKNNVVVKMKKVSSQWHLVTVDGAESIDQSD